MKKEIKFEEIKINKGKSFWFSAEYYENEVLKQGEGCHSCEKEKIKEIKEKFKNLVKK